MTDPRKNSCKKALKMMEKFDMLCLEEFTYKPVTWIQKLFDANRRLVHSMFKIHLDPIEGVLLARFYKRSILEGAFKAIPKSIIPIVVAHDHAIIYYEAYKISNKVGLLPKVVWHIEPATLVELWRKNYRYGKSTKELLRAGYYRDLVRKKVRFRKGALDFKYIKYGLQSYLLLVLKGIAYQIGYQLG